MQELGLIKSLEKIYLKACSASFFQSTECLIPDFSLWTPFRAIESQQLHSPWFNPCRCRWQVSIFSWQSPFLLINLTMILRGSFHDHFIPWCWECPFSGLTKILLTGHSMCWTRPLNSFQNSLCYSHAFQETDSLRRTMQIVECSLLRWWAQGRVFS